MKLVGDVMLKFMLQQKRLAEADDWLRGAACTGGQCEVPQA